MILHNNKSKQTKMCVYNKRHTMKLSRTRVMLYMLLIIGVLSLILALLSSPYYMAYITGSKEGLEGLEGGEGALVNVVPTPESNILPKPYMVELTQTKETTLPDMPSYGATPTDVFNQDTSYYINTVSVNRPKTLNKSAIFKVDQPTNIVLHMETFKTESFIVITPQEGGKFPSKFVFVLTNNIAETKLSLDLWGVSPTNDSVPSNSIIGSDNYIGYPYPQEVFETKDKDGKLVDGVLVGGLNIGNNALNIIGVGRIYDRKFADIGEVQNMGDKITITCNASKGLTGILIYLGKATVSEKV
jgi:hypothetical protein